PYQLLRAAYRLRGYEGLWTSLHGSLVIVDEVHAYEPDRLGLILGMLKELVTEWDVRICAFSATMPSWLHTLLCQTLQATTPPHDEALFQEFQRHCLELVDGEITDPLVIDRICQEVDAGRSVLVAVNTVARAQEVYHLLEQRLPRRQLELLHSRFTGRDRLVKEQRIIERLAPQHLRTPLAVVATQVIEVSLNLDFERIVTEPAPLEALAQRFGRVNRFGRYGIVPVWVLTGPLDGQGVYDQRLVERTLAVLRAQAAGMPLNEALLSQWLDQIYRDDLQSEWLQRIEGHRHEFTQACLASLRAFDSADDSLAEQFDKLFDGTEVLPAQLEGEYERLREHSVLSAQSLLVPVSRIGRLKSHLRWHQEFRLNIVDLPYDSEGGLVLP
ncbi:MAG: CRISPR-associated helicase Cas3', partial [Chloroflexota bacterium]